MPEQLVCRGLYIRDSADLVAAARRAFDQTVEDGFDDLKIAEAYCPLLCEACLENDLKIGMVSALAISKAISSRFFMIVGYHIDDGMKTKLVRLNVGSISEAQEAVRNDPLVKAIMEQVAERSGIQASSL